MANVFVEESSLHDIASAIREKNQTADTYTPSQMAAAIQSIPTGGKAAVLVPKAITENGTYDPADDSADGYSALTVDVHPGLLTPYAFDLDTGYVYYDSWMLGGDTINYSDVYQVTAGEMYIISLGSTVGSRFRAIFTTEDTTQAESKVPGSRIVNIILPDARSYASYKPSTDGYITITKDNAGTAGIKTYVYSGLSLALGNP